MADWSASTPWWVIVGLILTVAVALFKGSRWTGRVDDRLDTLSAAVTEIRKVLDSVLERIPKPPAVASGSPLRLTSLGERMRDQIGAGDIADRIAETLRERVSGLSAYDVQEVCFLHVRDEWEPDTETEEAIKQCAFDNGSEREEVLNVIAVEVRDRLLPEPPSD